MKRLFNLGVVFALVLTLTLPAHAVINWDHVAQRVSDSVVRLEISGTTENGQKYRGFCSAFSVDEADSFFMTDAHCWGQYLSVGYHLATVVYYNEQLDLMVLYIPGVHRPALDHAGRNAREGAQVAAVGYGQGWEKPSFRAGVVQIESIALKLLIGDILYDAVFTFVDFPFIGGMSGGPIVDTKGRVVSIVQASNGINGIGRPLNVILGATGAYWE